MSTVQERHPQASTHNNHSSCSWRLIKRGLNIEGSCTNSHCSAYHQMVIINLGFGEYDFSRIILQRANQCPICNQKIHPTKYALNQCQWWYVHHYSTRTFPLNIVHDTYELNDLNCEYIVMEIMPLPLNYRRPAQSQEIICPICLINIENDNEPIHLRCSHTFHRSCINEWLQSNESMANTCPLCRKYIIERY